MRHGMLRGWRRLTVGRIQGTLDLFRKRLAGRGFTPVNAD